MFTARRQQTGDEQRGRFRLDARAAQTKGIEERQALAQTAVATGCLDR